MTTITFDHVSKHFDKLPAVDGVTFKVSPGDMLAILGPSGCGKSTLLRLAGGLMTPDGGQVLYDNVLLDEIPLKDRRIGMVFQESALMPHWESRRSVSFFFSLRNRENEVPERVKRIAKITGIGLNRLLERRPTQLSGGEQQRVSIARALTRDLNVLLFDEPFAHLDAKLRMEGRIELKRLLSEFPATSLYVTHDQLEAISLAHRIAVMNQGKMEQIGTYHQLHDSPVNLFVAEFIGTPKINLFSGWVRDGHWQGAHFGGYSVRGDLPDDTKIIAGIRPEYIQLAADGFPAQVEAITPFFAERHLLIEVRADKDHWSLTAPLDAHLQVGSTIYCTFNPERLLYFDAHTGTRVG